MKHAALLQRDRSNRLPSRSGPNFQNLKITSKILILRLYLNIGPKVEPTPEPGGKGPGACFEFSLPKWGGQLPRQIGEQLEKQFERIRSYPIEGTIHRPQFESRGKICQF